MDVNSGGIAELSVPIFGMGFFFIFRNRRGACPCVKYTGAATDDGEAQREQKNRNKYQKRIS